MNYCHNCGLSENIACICSKVDEFFKQIREVEKKIYDKTNRPVGRNSEPDRILRRVPTGSVRNVARFYETSPYHWRISTL